MDVYSAAIAEIIARLTWHTGASNRLMWGWTFFDRPVTRMDGVKDFPALMVTPPDITESYRPRYYGTGTMRFDFLVSTPTSAPLTTHTAAVALAIDAVERRATAAAEVDPGLAGTILKPFEASVGSGPITDLTITSKVTLSLMPKAFNRGNRRRV